MVVKRNPTNSDIYRSLGRVDEKVSEIHDQVKRTNGRVSELERWKQSVDAVDLYKKENRPTNQEVKERWTARDKALTAIITALVSIIATLVATGKP